MLELPYKSFKLEIEIGNDDVQTANDIAKLLKKVEYQLNRNLINGVIFDENGNKVGVFFGDGLIPKR